MNSSALRGGSRPARWLQISLLSLVFQVGQAQTDPRLGAPPMVDVAALAGKSGGPSPSGASLVVNTFSRGDVVSFYEDVYLPAFGVSSNWTGSTAGCSTGTISPAYTAATLQIIDYFRAMAGLPAAISENAGASAKASEAALMMAANGALNHFPPTNWQCYTAEGDEAAGRSNLALGAAGPSSIDLYMRDPGAANYFVGHRRWLLYPPLESVGTGSTYSSNALWVIPTAEHPLWGSRPANPEWVAWPPAGFVPYQLIYPRWSLSRNGGADFSGATVSMTRDGNPVGVVLQPVVDGFGDNTLVWEPSGLGIGAGSDYTLHVQVSNVLVGGIPTTISYDVVAIDSTLIVGGIFTDSFEN